MAHQQATLSPLPTHLLEALHNAFTLTTADGGQRAAQPELIRAIRTALDARRQRIVISESSVGAVKWLAILFQALCTLVAIAMLVCAPSALKCAAFCYIHAGLLGKHLGTKRCPWGGGDGRHELDDSRT